MKIGSCCIGFLSTSPRVGDPFSYCLTRSSHAGRHRICQKNQNEKCTFDNENCLYHNDGKVEKGKKTLQTDWKITRADLALSLKIK